MLSEGCVETVVDGWPSEACVCVPAPGACLPGSSSCESDTALGYCDESQVWAVYDCDDVCAGSLATPMSLGCALDDDGVAACWCVAP
jgi:hypothetical protein